MPGALTVGASVASGAVWVRARATFSRPPLTVLPANACSGSVLDKSTCPSCHGVSPGRWVSTSAAAPATWGVAIEVPLSQA